MELEFVDLSLIYVREDERLVWYNGKGLRHKFRTGFTQIRDIVVEAKSGENGINEKEPAKSQLP